MLRAVIRIRHKIENGNAMCDVWDFFMVVSLVWLGKLLPVMVKQPNAATLRNPSFIAPKVSHFVPLKVKNHLRGSTFPDLSKYRGFCLWDVKAF